MRVTQVVFNPTQLTIVPPGTVTLRVLVAGIMEQGDSGRKVNVQLFDSDFLNPDDFLDSKTTTLPTNLAVGDLVRLTFRFVLSCVNGEIRGAAGGSGQSEAELIITFGPTGETFAGAKAICG